MAALCALDQRRGRGDLRELIGGYEFARLVHFVAMASLVGFVAVHIVMVALVPRTLVAMVRGR